MKYSVKTQAFAEFVRFSLPYRVELTTDERLELGDEVVRLRDVQPTHLRRDQLLELYLLELLESLKIDRHKNGV